MIFDPYPPTIGIPAKFLWRGFLILMFCDLWTIGTWGYLSPPLRHADVLNEWSLLTLFHSWVHCLLKNPNHYFEYVDFGPKMYLIFNPTLGNLTTHITTINNQWLIRGSWQKVVLQKLAEDRAEFFLCYVAFCGYLTSWKTKVLNT